MPVNVRNILQVLSFLMGVSCASLPTEPPESHGRRSPAATRGSGGADLRGWSGSFRLVEASGDRCPDGEFSGHQNQLQVGAAYRISKINEGVVKWTESDAHNCELRTKATFHNNRLDQEWAEKCSGGHELQILRNFQGLYKGGQFIIQLHQKTISRVPGHPAKPEKLQCRYEKINNFAGKAH